MRSYPSTQSGKRDSRVSNKRYAQLLFQTGLHNRWCNKQKESPIFSTKALLNESEAQTWWTQLAMRELSLLCNQQVFHPLPFSHTTWHLGHFAVARNWRMLLIVSDRVVLVNRKMHTQEKRLQDTAGDKWTIFSAPISYRHRRQAGWRNVKTFWKPQYSVDECELWPTVLLYDVHIKNVSMVWSMSGAAASKTAAEMDNTQKTVCSS